MVTTFALSAASWILFLASSRPRDGLGSGTNRNLGPNATPASNKTVTSLVCTKVHIERTPKLSKARGVTLIPAKTLADSNRPACGVRLYSFALSQTVLGPMTALAQRTCPLGLDEVDLETRR